MNTVSPTAPINSPSSATENHLSREERQQQLPIDKIVRATVTEGGKNQVMLELNQRQIQAETRVPLTTGQRLELLITATSPRIEMQIMDDPLQRHLAHSLHLLGKKWEISLLVEQLLKTDPPVISQLNNQSATVLRSMLNMQNGEMTVFSGKMVQTLIQTLGLNLEAILARGDKNIKDTLKAALFEILNKIKPSGDHDIPQKAGQLLQSLELSQLCQLRLAQQDLFLFPLPLPFFDQCYMIVEGDKHGDSEQTEKPFKLSLHLALQGLGDMRVDLLYEGQELFIRFVCDSTEKAEFISGFEEELKAALAPLPLPLRGITFASGADDPATSLLHQILPNGDSVLDMRV